MATLRIIAMAPLVLCAISCATTAVQQSPVQVRVLQTREFEADFKTVARACFNALQDDGYIVKNATSDLGVVSATKQVPRSDAEKAMWTLLLGAAIVLKAEVEMKEVPGPPEMDVTVNVTDFGNRSSVRANFAVRALGLGGGPVTDGRVYQQFFTKVDKAIFLEKQKL